MIYINILTIAIVVSLVSLLCKFLLSKYGISEKLFEWYDIYKKPWMPKRCEYCFNVELCVLITTLFYFYSPFDNFIFILLVAVPLINFFEK